METGVSTTGNGSKMTCMGRAQNTSQTANPNTRGNGRMEKEKDTELCTGKQMELRCTRALGLRVVDMDMALLTMKDARSTKESGLAITEKGLEANGMMTERWNSTVCGSGEIQSSEFKI